MDQRHRAGLLAEVDRVLSARRIDSQFRRQFPWLTGALGEPESAVWFVAENPSLRQLERVQDPQGGPPTEEAQWWASKGDRLFRAMLVKHGFKSTPPEQHGGWQCYITNAIKQPDYAEAWRKLPKREHDAALVAWMDVLRWELSQAKPQVVVALGSTVARILGRMSGLGLILPQVLTIHHYSYVALRPAGRLGPMHPVRVAEYDQQFGVITGRVRD